LAHQIAINSPSNPYLNWLINNKKTAFQHLIQFRITFKINNLQTQFKIKFQAHGLSTNKQHMIVFNSFGSLNNPFLGFFIALFS